MEKGDSFFGPQCIITHNATPSLIRAEALGANVLKGGICTLPLWSLLTGLAIWVGEFRHTLSLDADLYPLLLSTHLESL